MTARLRASSFFDSGEFGSLCFAIARGVEGGGAFARAVLSSSADMPLAVGSTVLPFV